MANTNPLADAYKKLVPNAPVFPPNGTSTAYPLAVPATPAVKPVTSVPTVSPTTGLATASTPTKTTQTSTIAPDDPSNKYNTQTGQLNPKYKDPTGATTGSSTGGPTRPNTMPADTGYTSSLNTGSTATQPAQPSGSSMSNADIMQKFTDLSTQAKTQYGFAIQTSEQEKQNTIASIQAQTGIDTQVLTNGYETAQATLNRAIGLVGMSAGIDKNKVQDLLDQNKSLFESFHSGLTSINANEQNAINNADLTQAKTFNEQGKQMLDFVSNLFTQQVAVAQKQQTDSQGLLTNMVNTGALSTSTDEQLIEMAKNTGFSVYDLASLRDKSKTDTLLSVQSQLADIAQKYQATATSKAQEIYYGSETTYKNTQSDNLSGGTVITTINNSNIDQVKQKIASQESGGDYSAVNKDSGALGKYQMMPSNLSLVGLTDSPEDQKKYLASPELQDKAYDVLMSQLVTQYNGDARKVVAAYYGGDGAAQAVDTSAGDKSQKNGPSINDYVAGILGTSLSGSTIGSVTLGIVPKSVNQEQAINGQGIIDGKLPPSLSGSMSGEKYKISAYLAANGYDLTKATEDWTAVTKWIATENSSTVQRAIVAADSANNYISNLRDLESQWKSTSIQPLNWANFQSALQGVQGESQQDIAQNIETQIADLTVDMGSVYRYGLSATDESLKVATKTLSTNWGDKQMGASLDTIENNLKIRINSLKNPQNIQSPSGQSNQYISGGDTVDTGGTGTTDYTSVLDSILNQGK
jgi:hypothetical protein